MAFIYIISTLAVIRLTSVGGKRKKKKSPGPGNVMEKVERRVYRTQKKVLNLQVALVE